MEQNILILINKEEQMTSFACDSRVKRIFGTRKVGHMGTLDPFATGLLPICVEKGLRFIRFGDNFDKTYRCTAVFGKTTDTQDKDGEVLSVNIPSKEELDRLKETDYKAVREAFAKVKDTKEQLPPKFSAKKINGRKAYDLARSGEEFELKPNKIEIYGIDILDICDYEDSFCVSFEVNCSKGTYIRTICEDVGKILGYGAYALTLQRIATGPFNVKDAITLDELEEKIKTEDYSCILNAARITDYMPEIKLSQKQTELIKNGRKLKASLFKQDLSLIKDNEFVRCMNEDELVAVCYFVTEENERILRIERMLSGN